MSDSLWPHVLHAARQASLSLTITRSLAKFMSIALVITSSHLVLRHPLLLLPSVFPSIRISSNESAVHVRKPEYWSFSVSISLSNEYSGLISFKIDWFDLLAVQGAFKSFLQHHSSKASIFQGSAIQRYYILYSPHCTFHMHGLFILQLEACASSSPLPISFPSLLTACISSNYLFVLCL